MTTIFLDYAIDLPNHILLKMPNVKILKRQSISDEKTKQISFKQLDEIDFENAFEDELKLGNNVIYISISSYFSSSVKKGHEIIDKLNKKYPNLSAVHIDTCNLSIGAGYLAYYAYCLVEQGVSCAEIKKMLDVHKLTKYCFFIVDDLKHLKESGKIDSNVISAGVRLNIKPILTLSPRGQLEKVGQVSGPKKAVLELVNLVETFGKNVADHRVGIIYSGSIQRAFDVRNSIIEKFNIENNIDIIEVNPQILSCTGDGVLGIVFNGKGVR